MKTSKTSSLPSLAALLLAGAAFLPASQAETFTWNSSTGGNWNTTDANWTSPGGTVAWSQGNDAVFNGFTAVSTVALTQAITASSLTLNAINGTGTMLLQGSTLDVPTISISVSSGNAFIDVSTSLTGNHGLTFSSTSGGRLNIKTAATYTGATVLSGSAYMNLDGSPNNLLPTGTLVTLNTGTTLRIGRNATASHQIAGLSGAGTVLSQSGSAQQHTLVISTNSANAAQTYTGSLNNTTSTLNLSFTGNGTQTISGGAKNYSGTTTITGGTLILGTSLSNTSAVTVNGGTLQTSAASVTLGVGDVTLSFGSVNIRGTNSIGTLVIGANQDFISTGGTILLDLAASADAFSQTGTGVFSLTNTTLALNTMAGFDYGLTYNIFNGFASGSISNLTITGYDSALYTAALGGNGQLSFTAVPEPSTYALLAIGALALVVIRRRQRRAA